MQNNLHAQTASPNCASLNLSIGVNDSSQFQVKELVTNADAAAPMSVLIENEFGGRIFFQSGLDGDDVISLPACRYRGQTLKVTVSNSISRCWGNITFKEAGGYNMMSNLDTTVWCNDPLASLDPNDFYNTAWYTTTAPFTLLPTAYVPCSSDDKVLKRLTDINRDGVINVRDARDWYAPRFEECEYFAIDWVEAFQCDESDTSKIVIREWEAYDNKGNRSVTTDTIRFIKLPDLASGNYIHAPQKDTVYCELFEVKKDGVKDEDDLCWKQLVGLHSDGTYIYYPKAYVDAVIAAANTQTTRDYLEEITIIHDVSASFKYSLYNLPGLPQRTGPDGSLSYAFKVGAGDLVLSNDRTYLTVDRNWFYIAGEHGFWVDLCIPSVKPDDKVETCDRWEKVNCAFGAQVILPNHPYTPDTCIKLCLTPDVLSKIKCFTSLHTYHHSVSYSCPRIDKARYEIKQSCYSENTATLQSTDCGIPVDESGIVSKNPEHHTIVVEQWRTYIDTLGPIVNDTKGQTTWITDEHKCGTEVRVPHIKAKDLCSGVKLIKATVPGYGWVNLTRGDDDYWYHSEYTRPFDLTCGKYPVTYELYDSCHNITVVQPETVTVVDQTPPTVVTDDRLRVSLGGKTIWLPAASLDEGSSDNCGIRTILVRRKDWKESCGVDLCNSIIEGLSSEAELDQYIRDYGITSVLQDNDVERFYAREFEWFRDDEEFCDIDGDGFTTDDNYVVHGWINEVKKYWAEECIPSEHPGHPKFKIDDTYSIGGGWASQVPFCCEDACEDVQVEVLVIDKECNYSKGWLIVEVEDKSPIFRACEFSEVDLSCTIYQDIYKETIDAAIQAGNNSLTSPEEFAAVDELLGGLLKGWRGPDGETLVDYDGNPMDKEVEYVTSECKYEIDWVKEWHIGHDGEGKYVFVYDTNLVVEKIDTVADLGGIYITCAATCKQDIWLNLNDCGVGTITRRWTVTTGCGTHHPDPMIFEQVIHVGSGCELSKHMFDEPGDSTICGGKLVYDGQGNVLVDAGNLDYLFDDLNCRQLGVGYNDEVFEVIGKPGVYKIHRNWQVSDWCTGENLECLQKIVIDENCEDTAGGDFSRGTLAGNIQTSYDNGMIQRVDVEARVNGSQPLTTSTSTTGSYSFAIPEGANTVQITPSKDINHLNGVDIVDIVLIQNHIIGKSMIGDENYKLVAADVNNDGRINGMDVIAIQRVTLQKEESFPDNKSWRFFDTEAGEETVTVTELSDDKSVDFVGIKIGDVDQKGVNLARSASALSFTAHETVLQKGQTTTIRLNRDHAIAAYQFALKYDGSKVAITRISGSGLTEENWNATGPNEVRVMYAGELGEYIDVELVAEADVNLSDVLAITDAEGFQAMAVTRDAGVVQVNLDYGVDNNFNLYQNSPNPARTQTVINFTLPEAKTAKLSFFDVSGKVLNVVEREFAQGINSVTVDVNQLGAAGVIYYQLETDQHTQTRKMVTLQ